MRRLIFTTAILILCGIFLLLWDSPPEAFLAKPTINTSEELPAADGYMLNTETIKYDDKGLRSYILTTTETRYFERGKKFELDKPEMVTFDHKNPLHPWQLNARQGKIFRGGERIVLTGDVYAWQDTSVTARNELRSQQLVLFPDTHIAESKKQVTINTPEGRTSGTGMWANLQQERFKLLKNVKGVHSAPH